MASSANGTTVQELRTQLESTRWGIHEGLHRVEDKLNVSRRIRTEFKEHPLRWVAVSAGVGIVAAKVLPLLLGGKKQGFFGRMFAPVVRMAAAAAVPLVAQKASEWMTQRGLSIPGLTNLSPPGQPSQQQPVPQSHPMSAVGYAPASEARVPSAPVG